MKPSTRNVVGVVFFAVTAVLLGVMAVTGLGEAAAETSGFQTLSVEAPLDLMG